MVSLLPLHFAPKIQHTTTPLTARTLVEHDAVIIVVNSNSAVTQLARCPQADFLNRQYARAQRRGAVGSLYLQDAHSGGGTVVVFIKPNASRFEQLAIGAKAWKELDSQAAEKVAITCLGFDAVDSANLLNSVLAAVLAGAAPMPTYKSAARRARNGSGMPALKAVLLLSQQATPQLATELAVTQATQAGNHLARWFTAQPPNLLNCGTYRDVLQQLAKREGWRAEFLNLAALKRLNAGAFLAVARANATRDAGILRLRYSGNGRATKGKRNAPTLSLVGKGICFDTGGINLKPPKGMYDMHTDMQGSAVAVGTLLALSRLKVPFAIDCWLALTENEIGPKAYRPQEIVTACNGTTIQVVHSDAEGRMALADTLALAAREQPRLIMDFATLTGACIAALSERMSGAFSNRDELRAAIERAGRVSGERVWSFPMDSDYDSDLDSQSADIMQCTLDSKADQILAARFLNRFVPESVPWVHLDMSSSTRSGGLAHIPTEITGFGVRWAVEFVSNYSLS